nr:DUF4233 domain-containing protein [Microlunatus panaciterrae]
MRSVLLSVLIFEVIIFGLAIAVMLQVSKVAVGPAVGFGSVAAALALVAAGLLRRPVGFVIGWLTQGAAILLGLLTPAMFLVGGFFAGLWLISFILGKRLDAGKREVVADPDGL